MLVEWSISVGHIEINAVYSFINPKKINDCAVFCKNFQRSDSGHLMKKTILRIDFSG